MIILKGELANFAGVHKYGKKFLECLKRECGGPKGLCGDVYATMSMRYATMLMRYATMSMRYVTMSMRYVTMSMPTIIDVCRQIYAHALMCCSLRVARVVEWYMVQIMVERLAKELAEQNKLEETVEVLEKNINKEG